MEEKTEEKMGVDGMNSGTLVFKVSAFEKQIRHSYVRASQIYFQITTKKMQRFLIVMELVHLIDDSSKQQYWFTIPEALCTVLCS